MIDLEQVYHIEWARPDKLVFETLPGETIIWTYPSWNQVLDELVCLRESLADRGAYARHFSEQASNAPEKQ